VASPLWIVDFLSSSWGKKWTRDFAVEIDEFGPREAELAVGVYGFHIVRKLDALGNVYHIRHKKDCGKTLCGRPDKDLIRLLTNNPYVKNVQQQEVLDPELRDRKETNKDQIISENLRAMIELSKKFHTVDREYQDHIVKRSLGSHSLQFNDPGWKLQWQSDNKGQFQLNPGLDMNLMNLYTRGYHGEGVVITVVDDGVDTQHPELRESYDPIASIDLNDPTDATGNPRGPTRLVPLKDAHGTSVGGEIAGAANNSFCGVGVAYKARLGGIRMLAGPVTDLLEAYALTYNPHYVDIYSNSWGPKDNGIMMKMPNKYIGLALKVGAEKGRNGKGNIFTFASGNGGYNNDNCGADGYVNSPYSIAFTSINIYGENARYDEHCAAMSVAMPVGGSHNMFRQIDPLIVTSSINGGCSNTFVGTSAATPLGSACIGLALQANKNLTWRDVQHLLPRSARMPNRHQQVWQRNGAGHFVSHFYGFGLLDCAQMVHQAQLWTGVGPQHNCTIGTLKMAVPIKSKEKARFEFYSDNCENKPSKRVDRAEHVMVRVRFQHARRGDLSFWLISPSGTISPLMVNRRKDGTKALTDFTFLTRMTWDENPRGKWILEIADIGAKGGTRKSRLPGTQRGIIHAITLYVLGTAGSDHHSKIKGAPVNKPSYKLNRDQVIQVFHQQREKFLQKLPLHRKAFELLTELKWASKMDKYLQEKVKEVMKDPELRPEDLSAIKEGLKRFEPSSINKAV
jgi:hypothetical protein